MSESQAPNAKVADPIPGMIVAINMYLHAYHMYRAAALNKPEMKRLDNKSRDLGSFPKIEESGRTYITSFFGSSS